MISLSWNHVLWCWYCERWGIMSCSVHWIQSQTEILGINKIYGHHRWNWIRLSTRHISSSWQDHISLFNLSWNPTFPTIDSGLDHRYNLYSTNSNCWSQSMKEKLTRYIQQTPRSRSKRAKEILGITASCNPRAGSLQWVWWSSQRVM